jgi:glutathione S-transferase
LRRRGRVEPSRVAPAAVGLRGLCSHTGERRANADRAVLLPRARARMKTTGDRARRGKLSAMSDLVLVGRSSSHFTRVARIFALELGVPHAFRPVFDMTSLDAATYADNPALKVPILVDERGPLFGTENICRELVRRSGGASRVVLRGEVTDRAVANAEELTLHAMSTGVSLIMAKMSGGDGLAPPKVRRSLENSLRYLDENLDAVLAALPANRALSFIEVALFCVVTHLPFREVMDVAPYHRLVDFCGRFAERQGARDTEYRFDAKAPV